MNQNPKIIRHINNKKIEVEEIYSTPPKRVDELRGHIRHLLKMAKEFENNFKKFNKSGISRDFLYLNWNFKEAIEQWIEHYEIIDGSSFSGRVGKPPSDEVKLLAKKYVEQFQAKAKDSNKFPTAKNLHEILGPQIDDLVLKGIKAPDISERTCSGWLTEMRRGTFRIKSKEDPWDWLLS